MIQPTPVFKDNLAQMPAIDGIARIELIDGGGAVVASIENQPGKQGSLAVYHYLQQAFGTLDAKLPNTAWPCSPNTRPMHATAPVRTRTSTACWRSWPARRRCASTWWPTPESGFAIK